MKKIKLLVLLLIAAPLSIFGQALEISAHYGWMSNGSSNYVDGDVDVFSDWAFGATIGKELANGMQVQFLYIRNSTDGEARVFFPPADAGIYPITKIVVETFHLGVEKPLGGNEMVRPYGMFSLGITNYAPVSTRIDDVARFSIGLGAGVKVFPKERFGLKFQARLLMPLLFNGVGVFCSSGSGCGGGASFYVPIVHGEFSGGVVFRIEK